MGRKPHAASRHSNSMTQMNEQHHRFETAHAIHCAKCGRENLYSTPDELHATSEDAECADCGFLYYAFHQATMLQVQREASRDAVVAALLESRGVEDAMAYVDKCAAEKPRLLRLINHLRMRLQIVLLRLYIRLRGYSPDDIPGIKAIQDLRRTSR